MPRKNQQTVNEFLMYTLNLNLMNRRWSWDAYGEGVVVLKLWARRRDELLDGIDRIEVWAPPRWRRPFKLARNERRSNIERLNAGGATYAVLVGGVGPEDHEAWEYESDRLYKLNRVVVDHDGYEYAIVDHSVSIAEFLTYCAESRGLSRI